MHFRSIFLNGGGLFVDHTAIQYSGDVGVFMNGGLLDGTSSMFTNNLTGISVAAINSAEWFALTNCILESNASYGLSNATAVTLDATNNWWGSASGPTHSSNPGGTGQPVSGTVIVSPFLTVRP